MLPVNGLVDRQDYLWFLALLGWTFIAMGWFALWRHDPARRWVVWMAGYGIACSVIEWLHLVVPVELRAAGSSWKNFELVIGGFSSLLGLGWAWLGQHGSETRRGRRRSVAIILALVVVTGTAQRWWHPKIGNVAVAFAVVGTGCALLVQEPSRGWRVALALCLGAVFLGTNGPVAEWLDAPHRGVDIGAYGMLAALAQIVASCAVLVPVVSTATLELGMPRLGALRDCRPIASLLLSWLLLGSILAELAGTRARQGFESGLVARCNMATGLLDSARLERALGPATAVDGAPPKIPRRYDWPGNSAPLRGPAPADMDAVSEQLLHVEQANEDILWAFVATVHQDWLMGFVHSPKLAHLRGRATYLTSVDADSLGAWRHTAGRFHEPCDFYYGRFIRASAPILGIHRQWIGTLVFDLSVTQWLSAQAQARMQAFLVVGLGALLIIASWWQRGRTRQRQIAEQRATAAIESNAIKTAFLAKVSHELRTPIQNVLGYAELLRETQLDRARATKLDALQQQGELLVRLVNDLVDLSAMESGLFKLNLRPVQVKNLIEQVTESFRPRIEDKGLSLEVRIASTVPEWVEADPERIRQIAVNLLGNAAKFTQTGAITVELARGTHSAGSVILTVQDTGPGISAQDMPRLFQPFSRLVSASGIEGAGLGLAISRALSQSFHGQLTVESDGETGSRFVAEWELPACTACLPEECPPNATSLVGLRVLVIDDNVLVRELFVASLAERGAICASAPDGRTGLKRALSESFMAIVLDLGLPGLSGIEVARALREAGREVLIIGVSAHAGAVERRHATDAGMDVFLVKPIALGQLVAAVANGASRSPSQEAERSSDSRLRTRLASRFRSDAQNQERRMRDMAAQRNWTGLRAAAHYLHNSASVIQDAELLESAAHLERIATSGAEDEIALAVARCSSALATWLHSPPHFFSPQSNTQIHNSSSIPSCPSP